MQSISTKELPEWFKLSRYEKLDRLELRDWLPNLTSRAKYLNSNLSLEKCRNAIEDMLGENDKQPLIQFYDDVAARLIDYPFSYPRGRPPKTSLNTLTVKSLQAGYVALTFNMISAAKDDLSRQIAKAAESLKFDESSEEIHNLLDQPIDLLANRQANDNAMAAVRGYFHVEVDLRAPDKVIVDDFSRWLEAARSEFQLPAQKIFTEATQNDLVTYRVLPYLDLTLWAALEQVTIPHAVMADALFADAIDVDSPYRVRKVTKVKADWAIQWPVIEALARQIVDEA